MPPRPGTRPLAATAVISAIAVAGLFSGTAARRAAKYEFQLAADPNFESIVIGDSYGSFQTRNTFATVHETLPNDNYFWRVRSINDQENAGKWSPTRKFRKN